MKGKQGLSQYRDISNESSLKLWSFKDVSPPSVEERSAASSQLHAPSQVDGAVQKDDESCLLRLTVCSKKLKIVENIFKILQIQIGSPSKNPGLKACQTCHLSFCSFVLAELLQAPIHESTSAQRWHLIAGLSVTKNSSGA